MPVRGTPLLVLLTAALLAAAPARGFEVPPEGQAVLARGGPYVAVKADPGGASGLIRGAIDVAAPPVVVWQVMTDCDLAPKLAAELKSCRILQRDPAGRWDVREHISRMTFFLPPVRSVFRSDYDPPWSIRFHRVAGDLKVLEGSWAVEPLASGAGVRVFYENRVAAPFSVPGPIARSALRRDVPAALIALRREALARK